MRETTLHTSQVLVRGGGDSGSTFVPGWYSTSICPLSPFSWTHVSSHQHTEFPPWFSGEPAAAPRGSAGRHCVGQPTARLLRGCPDHPVSCLQNLTPGEGGVNTVRLPHRVNFSQEKG